LLVGHVGLLAASPKRLRRPTPEAIPTVEELAANPERLKELRQQCKTDRPKLGDVLCNRVAEATRKRFYGDGERCPTHRRRSRRSSDRWRFATPSLVFLLDTPQCASRLRRFSLVRPALNSMSFCSTFLLETVFDRH
jgi:hypothetical protein